MTEDPPHAVLFACNLNSIRSPMAEGLMRKRFGADVVVQSCGIYEGGYLDPFMLEAMREVGVDMVEHQPKIMDELGDNVFDVIVALTPESYRRAKEYASALATSVEFWPALDPARDDGGRESRMRAYREVRDALSDKIEERFGRVSTLGG